MLSNGNGPPLQVYHICVDAREKLFVQQKVACQLNIVFLGNFVRLALQVQRRLFPHARQHVLEIAGRRGRAWVAAEGLICALVRLRNHQGIDFRHEVVADLLAEDAQILCPVPKHVGLGSSFRLALEVVVQQAFEVVFMLARADLEVSVLQFGRRVFGCAGQTEIVSEEHFKTSEKTDCCQQSACICSVSKNPAARGPPLSLSPSHLRK